MRRDIVDVVIQEKADFLLEIDQELLDPELAEMHEDLRYEAGRILDGELEQLLKESWDYWERDKAAMQRLESARQYWLDKVRKPGRGLNAKV